MNGMLVQNYSQPSDGQGSLACCSPWGREESDTTEFLSNNGNLQVESFA